jgi:hypothetical protein
MRLRAGLQGKSWQWLFSLVVAFGAVSAASAADEWLPITPEDLQMKSDPKAPAAPAVYLYRQVDRDDNTPDEEIYARIKVLTEEGRKYANVEIPYLKERESIRALHARTIRPDGTVIPFDGEVFEKSLLRARGVRFLAKTFTLPNVEVGSIIEYRFRRMLASGVVFDSRWLLSQDLFTRHAKFSLRPYSGFALRWSWPMGLPEGTEAPTSERNVIRLETRNVPAFVTEEYMPPEDVIKYRVEFIYDTDPTPEKDSTKFWKAYGKTLYRSVNTFTNDRRAMEQAVAQIVQPGDSPEEKVRKIYARTQQIRNTSFDRQKSEQEEKRENLREANDASLVWKRGYGDAVQMTWLFLALVRAAGIEADPLLIPTRDSYFFNPRLMNPGQLNSNAVLVKLDGRELYLDPGTPFTPYGLLPWSATGVTALRLDKAGGSWVTTPASNPTDSRIERKVAMKLAPNGTLTGKVTVTYTGLEASWRRFVERHDDEKERREFLEDDVERDIPVGIDVKLTNTPDWSSSDTPLVAEYDLTVGGWASGAGKRLLMPVGLFGGGEKHTFEHSNRVHSLYFQFPYQHSDDLTIELPQGWQVSSVPKPRVADLKLAKYTATTEDGKTQLRLKRELMLNLMLIEAKSYPALRGFFQSVRAGDEDQVVLSYGAPAAPR